MKKFFVFGLITLFAAFFVCGCASLETLSDADITVAELEEKMEKAMDPEGAFKKASSYVQREMFKIEGIFFDTIYQNDLKYKKPHYLRLLTLENNQPLSALIYNSGSAWTVDYNEKKVTEITGSDLIKFNMLQQLTTPDKKYSQLFKKVDIFKCTLRDDPTVYYKLVCKPQNEKNTISIYVDAKDFLPRHIKAELSFIFEGKEVHLDYDCTINAYELMDDVMIPREVTCISNDIVTTTTVFDYKLNVNIPDSEFLPPVFVEKKLQNRMDRFAKDNPRRGLRRSNLND